MPKEYSEWEWDWNEEETPEDTERRRREYEASVKAEGEDKEFVSSNYPQEYRVEDGVIVAYPTKRNNWSLYYQYQPAPDGWEGYWGEYFGFVNSEFVSSREVVLNQYHDWLENCE